MQRETETLPAWYNDAPLSLVQAWQLLTEAVKDRHSAFHLVNVSTIGLDGRPRSRLVVVRDVCSGTRTLRFHTDIRSEKFRELSRDSRIAVHAYDPRQKIQIRLEGRVMLHHNDDTSRDAWGQSQMMSKACYAVRPGSGTPIATGDDFLLPATPSDISAGEAHFCAVIICVDYLEWVYLAAEGHQRLQATWHGSSEPAYQWLVP